MDFRACMVRALAGTLADNLVLSEQAADTLAQDVAVTALRRMCALALDPSLPDAQALAQIRALGRKILPELRTRGF